MIRFLFILFFLSASLLARLNPFEPVDGIEDTKEPRQVTNLNTKDDGNRTVKIVTEKKNENKQEPKKTTKKESNTKLATEMKKSDNEPKVVSPKTLEPTQISKKVDDATVKNNTNETVGKEEPKEVTSQIKKVSSKKTKYTKTKVSKSKKSTKKVVAKRVTNTKIASQRYNILPLVTIDIVGDNLTIRTTSNNKLIRYYEEKNENKFVFDFEANIGVPTAREDFNSKYYQSYTVGNHPEEGYFRVVIPVKDSVKHYKVMIKNNIGTIIRK